MSENVAQVQSGLFDMERPEILPGEVEVRESHAFVVDNDAKAEWCLNKLREIRGESERLIKTANDMIGYYQNRANEVRKKAHDQEQFFMGLLRMYFEQVPHRETKTMLKYELPSGELVEKKPQRKLTKGDELELVRWVKDNAPEFLELKESVKWGDLKKKLTYDEDTDAVIIAKTGEIVPATVELIESAFDVKLK